MTVLEPGCVEVGGVPIAYRVAGAGPAGARARPGGVGALVGAQRRRARGLLPRLRGEPDRVRRRPRAAFGAQRGVGRSRALAGRDRHGVGARGRPLDRRLHRRGAGRRSPGPPPATSNSSWACTTSDPAGRAILADGPTGGLAWQSAPGRAWWTKHMPAGQRYLGFGECTYAHDTQRFSWPDLVYLQVYLPPLDGGGRGWT